MSLPRSQTKFLPYRFTRSAWILWFLALAVFPVWCSLDRPGWDVAVYASGMRAVHAGIDPYEAAMALQRAYHAHHTLQPGVDPPYSYVYSPITLPALRLIAYLPLWFSAWMYWSIYAACALAAVWAALRFVEPEEQNLFAHLGALAVFFPGLLANGTIQSGNIAYVLYACALLAALYGWRHERWGWFYAAVLCASCVKAPLLSLTLIAPFSSRKQILPAVGTLAAGIALFGIQPFVWSSLFRHYLEAVELQFSYNRDFGCSLAGLYSGYRFDHGLPYAPAAYFCYLLYALPVFACLAYLARRYQQGDFPLKQWAPVLLVGVVLFNPRLMEYDVAPITMPMALILWRWLGAFTRRSAVVLAATVTAFLILNGLSIYSWEIRKQLDGPLLILTFAAGVWTLLQRYPDTAADSYRETPSRGELAEA